MTDFGMRCRFAVGVSILALAFAGLGVRLAFLHVGTHEHVRSSLARVRSVEREILPSRGNIYDCQGKRNILALDLAARDVCVDPQFLVKSNMVDTVAAELAGELGLSRRDLSEKLEKPDRRFAYVQRYVPDDQLVALREKKLPGVFFREATVRYYPQQEFMCHVLGFVNYERVGSAGVEQATDRYLRGSPGWLESQVDGFRRELYTKRSRSVAPIRGADVFLTIDQNVQYILEQALDDVVEEHRAKGAWAIMQRVRTGEILAMASRPAYDLNVFRTVDSDCKLNRAIGYVYEPGSTLKIATIAAALNEGTVRPNDVYNCENGAWFYKRRVLHDYHPYSSLTVADGLKKSSNILAAKVALTLGDRRLHRYMSEFGLGDTLGIDLPGEECGILRQYRRWSAIDATRIAIGQGIAVTALQMVGVAAAIANDGFLMKPYVVASIVRDDGTVMLNREPEVLGQPIRPDTAALMRRLLGRVTEDGGTGKRARVEGFTVAGKTGTAQKAKGGRYVDKYMASFVGFLPVNDPQIAMVVVVDEPEPKHTGGYVAAPVFGRIASQAVRCLDIDPAGRRIVAGGVTGDLH